MSPASHFEFRDSYIFFIYIRSPQSISPSDPTKPGYMNVAQAIEMYAENKSFVSFKISGDIEITCTIKSSSFILSSMETERMI